MSRFYLITYLVRHGLGFKPGHPAHKIINFELNVLLGQMEDLCTKLGIRLTDMCQHLLKHKKYQTSDLVIYV